MIYKDVTILDKNLHPLNRLGYGGRFKFELLEKIANYANTHDTKIVSVVKLNHPGEASAFGVDDIIKIGKRETGIINFGIWKVFGDPSTLLKLNTRKETPEEREIRREHEHDTGTMTKLMRRAAEERRNPRKKEMKMGAPDKKTSLFKIMDEIDETPNEYRFRMQPPSKFHEKSLKYGKKPITKGVRAIYGCPKAEWAPRLEKCKKGMSMQSLRLSKDVFHSKTEAAGWIARHTKPRRE